MKRKSPKSRQFSKYPRLPIPPIPPIPSSPLEKSARIAADIDDRILNWLKDLDAGRNPEQSLLRSFRTISQTLNSNARIYRQYDQHINPPARANSKLQNPTQKDTLRDKEAEEIERATDLAHLAEVYSMLVPGKRIDEPDEPADMEPCNDNIQIPNLPHPSQQSH